MFAYDDILSINFFGDRMRPYWQHIHGNITQMLEVSNRDYGFAQRNGMRIDMEVISEAFRIGGKKYATLISLAYRQAVAGCKLVWSDKLNDKRYFLKEISSDGDLQTSDVAYPGSPFLLRYNPELLKLMLLPLFSYANNETYDKYKFDFAPHHLGFYPIGDIKNSQQENMPIEETGNLILMVEGVAGLLKNIDFVYPKYWKLITSWANYLKNHLPDPRSQRSSDDFEGKVPHNANLAAKGIIALDAAANLFSRVGDKKMEEYYRKIVANYTQSWKKLANPDNSDHYRERYDKSGFSLKYNLVYQKFLGLNTFPKDVFDLELSYYMKKMNRFGVPLVNTATYTKIDWMHWVAAFATEDQFQSFVSSTFDFANTTTPRLSLCDWYDTLKGNSLYFSARPVVGGLFSKMAVFHLENMRKNEK